MDKYSGLSKNEVLESRKKYGTNEIKKETKNGFFSLLLESLSDPIIKILLIALTIKIVFLFRDFDWFETLGILIAIFLASFISTISEYGSEKAFERLQEESSKVKCRVKRDGKIKEITIDEVVKNDIVILQYGDKVPADGILIKGDLMIDESSLNGEAKEIHKEPVKNTKACTKNKLFRGTLVCSGEGLMYTTMVGENTFYGRIAKELKEKKGDSPLKIRLRNLAKIISTFGYIGAFLASISYLFSVVVVDNNFALSKIVATVSNFHLMMNYIIYALTLSVTIIIVSVPEGLPMMITLVLSSNMRRMLKENVLVRKLVGIETAGNVNILFSDKTGTLTTGRLNVTNIIDGGLNNYKNEDEIKKRGINFYNLLRVSMVVNNMSTYDGKKVIGGNITDRSLLEFLNPCNFDDIKILKTIAFNSKDKYMITVLDDKKIRNLIKGAPEKIINNCSYYYNNDLVKIPLKNKVTIQKQIDNYTKQGSRVIAIATSNNKNERDFTNLTLVGIVIIKDEVRKEAIEGIKMTKSAGIKTVMITGDNKDTAVAIAKEIGIIENKDDIILTSDELNNMSDLEVKEIIPNLKVVARSLPQDKSRLVRITKEMGLVVGMTGDGVNDAPALKKADVGFSMGSGSEVSKEASDIVILDNNFLSISKAILFGRTIFKSIRKFVIFQLTVNLCALAISIIGPFIGVDTPVTVLQMLWINMVMDTLAGLAFAFEPPLKEFMEEKPKKKDENIMNGYMLNEIIITGLYTTILCILFLKFSFVRTLFSSNESFMTAFFGLFIFVSIFNCFNAHTSRINIFAHLSKNKMFLLIISLIIVVQVVLIYYGGTTFRTIPLSIKEFAIMLVFAFTVVPIDIIRKILYKKKGKNISV